VPCVFMKPELTTSLFVTMIELMIHHKRATPQASHPKSNA
jgi:hypothetical protein